MCCHAWWWSISFFFHSPAPRNPPGSLVGSRTSAAVLRPLFMDPKLPPPEDLCPFSTPSCSDMQFGHDRRNSLHRLLAGSAGVFLGVLWQDEVSPSIPHQILPDLGNAASFLGTQCCSTAEDELTQLPAWKCPCSFPFHLTHFLSSLQAFHLDHGIKQKQELEEFSCTKIIGFCVTQAGIIQPFCSRMMLVTDNVEDVCAQSYQIFQLAQFPLHWLIQTCWSARPSFLTEADVSSSWTRATAHPGQEQIRPKLSPGPVLCLGTACTILIHLSRLVLFRLFAAFVLGPILYYPNTAEH